MQVSQGATVTELAKEAVNLTSFIPNIHTTTTTTTINDAGHGGEEA